jgi:hypothetical protein
VPQPKADAHRARELTSLKFLEIIDDTARRVEGGEQAHADADNRKENHVRQQARRIIGQNAINGRGRSKVEQADKSTD